jgi:hypothetical protein
LNRSRTRNYILRFFLRFLLRLFYRLFYHFPLLLSSVTCFNEDVHYRQITPLYRPQTSS